MPITGAKPQDVKRHRNPETYEWLEVLDVPYEGASPDLPNTHEVTSRGGKRYEMTFQQMTKDWWEVIRRMPHCVKWSDSDWQFALATSIVADEAFSGNIGAAAELRQRERFMGTTMDARRDLRIKYVSELSGSNEVATESSAPIAGETSTDRRAKLLSVV